MKYDDQFESYEIIKVAPYKEGGYMLTFENFCLYCPDSVSIEPKPGMTAKLYGKGVGFPVRGLVIGYDVVFYRTEDEEKAYQDAGMYGKDAMEWLKWWDSGRSVWTIEMGGLGPGYEQAIQVAAAEILRHLLDKQYNDIDLEEIRRWSLDNDVIHKLGLSGAQFESAICLAIKLYVVGPIKIMNTPKFKDRRILVNKFFPST